MLCSAWQLHLRLLLHALRDMIEQIPQQLHAGSFGAESRPLTLS
jgi:hypothetical protein